MGKDELLDTSDKTGASIKKTRLKTTRIRKGLSLVFAILIAVCTYSCAFPRIIILDDPLSPEEHLNLGVTYEKSGELDSALKEYETASKKLALGHLYMGNIYLKKREFDSAEASYKKAIKKDPKNADAYNNLAWLYYLRKENLDEAEGLVSKAIDLNPAKADIYRDTLEKIRETRDCGR